MEPVKDLYGLDANQVLVEVMDTEIRNEEVQAKINKVISDKFCPTWLVDSHERKWYKMMLKFLSIIHNKEKK